jgi:4'-phosphopantetheinyl transferase
MAGSVAEGATTAVATVDVWTGRVADLVRASAPEVLAADEVRRASTYRHPGARARFVAGRILARRVLGVRLGLDARAVPLVVLPSGRPVLRWPADIAFSLSHTGALVVLAVGVGVGGVGVDVERIRPLAEAGRIARAHFPPTEHAAFLAMPPEERGESFFRAWTRMEARFKLAADTNAPAVLHEWVPETGYRAALATRVSVAVRHMPPPGGD